MAGTFGLLVTLLAQDTPPEAPPPGGPAGLAGMLLPMAAVFVVFYFLMMRPQRREQAKREAMIKALKPNDRVVTIGGIHGIVASVSQTGDIVTLKIDESSNTKIRVSLGAIARVVADDNVKEA